MKSGRSLVDLAKEIERRSNAKKDFVAKTNGLSLSVLEPNDTDADFDRLLRVNVGDGQFSPNEIFHDQLGTFCDIPAKYYDRCRKEDPALLAHNVNTWLSRGTGKRLVRTLDNTARAFLSDRYRPLENEDLAAAILPTLLESKHLDIMSCEVTSAKLYIKVVDKAVTRELAKTGNYFGDQQHRIVRITSPAITISNSEVGYGALSIQAGIFDSFCSNLATFSERSLKKYHVGSRHDLVTDELYALLSDDTRKKTDAALWSQVRDVVKGAFAEDRFNALCDSLDEAQTDKIDKEADVVKVVNLTGRKIGLTEKESGGVLRHLIEGGDLSRYGLYNAVTRFSQDVENYDRATDLERLGGAVMELPKNEWSEIAKAQ
jgi:hypothetical protein